MRRAKGRVVSKSPEGDERYPVRRGAQSLSRTWTIVDTCDSVDRPEVVSMVVASCKSSGKGAAHFVSFCDMAFSALFRISLLLPLFIAFFVLNLEKSGKRSAKCCKSRKSHAPLSFCILFQCVKIS